MEFNSNVDFRASSGGQGYQPLKVPDITPLMRDNLNTELSEIKNSGAQALQALKATNQMLQRNAKIEDEFSKIAGLTKFSQTLQNELVNFAEQKKKKDIEEGMNLAYMTPASDEELDDFYAQEQALFDAETKINDAAFYGMKNGAPYSAADTLKGLSGWKAYGYALAMADEAVRGRGAWISNKMATDNETEIRVRGREPFTPATAVTPSEKAAARAKLNAQYENATGLSSIDTKFKQARVYPKFREQDAKQDQVWARQYNIDLSAAERSEALQEFLAHGNLSQLLNRYRSTVDNDNNPLGYTGAWKLASKDIQLLIQQKRIQSIGDIDGVFSQPIPGRKGKTFKSEYPHRYQEAVDFLRGFKTDEYNFFQAERRRREAEANISYQQMFAPGEVTEERIQELQAEHIKEYGKPSAYLNTLSDGFSVDDYAKTQWNVEAEKRAIASLLTPEFVLSMPTIELQQRWMPVAEKQYKDRQDTGNFKTANKAITGLVNTYIKSTPDGTSSFEGEFLKARLQNLFLEKYNTHRANGIDPGPAEKLAANETKTEFIERMKIPTDDFYKSPDANNPFPNMFNVPGPVKEDAMLGKQRLSNIYSKMNNAATREDFLKKENSILSKAQLEEAAKGFGTPGWKVHPLIRTVANTYRLNPLQLFNMLLDYNKLPKLEIPEVVGLDNLTNGQRNLLYAHASPNRGARAGADIGTYVNKYFSTQVSDIVVSAATAAGNSPSLMAGLAMKESSGRTGVQNSIGATGLYQILLSAHPNVSYQQAIDPVFAAKYANDLLNQYTREAGGNILGGLARYGGYGNGQGAIDAAMEPYIKPIIRYAAEFGYKGPLLRELTRPSMRSSLPPEVISTTNP